MKVTTDFHSVNLSKGTKTRSIVGEGEVMDEIIGPVQPKPQTPSEAPTPNCPDGWTQVRTSFYNELLKHGFMPETPAQPKPQTLSEAQGTDADDCPRVLSPPIEHNPQWRPKRIEHIGSFNDIDNIWCDAPVGKCPACEEIRKRLDAQPKPQTLSELYDAAENLLKYIWEVNYLDETETEYEKAIVRLRNALLSAPAAGGSQRRMEDET